MASLIIWVIVIAVALIILIKAKEIGHKFKFNILLFFIVIVLGTMGYVWMKTGVNLMSKDGVIALGKYYYSWLAGIAGNIGSITGYVVQHDWGFSNVTSSGLS